MSINLPINDPHNFEGGTFQKMLGNRQSEGKIGGGPLSQTMS